MWTNDEVDKEMRETHQHGIQMGICVGIAIGAVITAPLTVLALMIIGANF